MVSHPVSYAEIKLFKAFGKEHLIGAISAMHIYRYLIEEVFVNQSVGNHVEALRRVWQANLSRVIYRMTEEWDSLISFED